jgi:hypothetical protein
MGSDSDFAAHGHGGTDIFVVWLDKQTFEPLPRPIEVHGGSEHEFVAGAEWLAGYGRLAVAGYTSSSDFGMRYKGGDGDAYVAVFRREGLEDLKLYGGAGWDVVSGVASNGSKVAFCGSTSTSNEGVFLNYFATSSSCAYIVEVDFDSNSTKVFGGGQ